MVAKIVKITAELAGLKRVDLPEYAGLDLLLLRGGMPFSKDHHTVLSTGGFELSHPDDLLALNEEFAVFPQPSSSNGMSSGGFGVSQYPHLITIRKVAGSVKNASGNWTSTPATAVEKAGRFEPNTRNAQIPTADGTMVTYAGIIYMPLPQEAIAPGTQVEVLSGAGVLLKQTVKAFNAGQFNVRVWL